MFFARTALAVLARLAAHSSPQPVFPHPAAQRFRMYQQTVFFGQVLGRQRRTETFLFAAGILFAHQSQHLLTQLWLATIREPSCAAMPQPHRSLLPVPPHQPLGLPVAHLQQYCRIPQTKFATHHPRHNLHSP